MANRLEDVCHILLEKGFPSNINAPIFGAKNPDPSKFIFPSYFFLSMALELDGLTKAMVKLKPNVNTSWYRVTPLHIAACKGNLSTIQLLLSHGALPSTTLPVEYYILLRSLKQHQQNERSRTSTPIPSKRQNSIFRTEPFNKNDYGAIVRQLGDRSVVHITSEFVADKEIFPFELAAICGHRDVTKFLLSRTDVRLLASSSFSLLVISDLETIIYLLKCGVNPLQRDTMNSTALHIAARAGKLEQVISYMMAGVDVNTLGQNDW